MRYDIVSGFRTDDEPICKETVAVRSATVNDLQTENWLKTVQLIESRSRIPALLLKPLSLEK